MLPDLPLFKSKLLKCYIRYLQSQTRKHTGVFQEVGRHKVHEGDRLRMIRSDGTIEDSNFKSASSELVVKFDEVENLTPERRIDILDKMAIELGEQMSRHLFESLGETLDKAGQVVDRQGKGFDCEAILEIIESIQIDFDEAGKHSPLTLVHGNDITQDVRKVFFQLTNDPVYNAKYELLMTKKKAEWHAREASRKLVG